MLRPVLAARRDLSQRKDHQVHETTSVGRGPQRRLRFRRPGVLLTAIGAAALLAAGCSAAFASSSPAPVHGHIYWTNGHWIGRARLSGTGVNQKFITGAAYGTGIAVSSGYLYWANLGGIPPRKSHGTIGRARLNGTDVSQKFITGASLPVGVTAAGGYLYWANNATGTIGRARLNGTGVNQRFIITRPSTRQIGLFGAAVAPGR
jgi:hypothetical protein